MGGSSWAGCLVNPEGLVLEGELIEEGGGFVSCRSELLSTPVDLSAYRSLQLQVDGEGRTLKLAVFSAGLLNGLQRLIPTGLSWVAAVPTQTSGTSVVEIPFKDLKPMAQAKPIWLPRRFDSTKVTRLQLLHSKFGDNGELNPGFRAGPIRILIRSIEAVG
ncbi:MAG: CIA30 family protein [Prochlorococcus sp.]